MIFRIISSVHRWLKNLPGYLKVIGGIGIVLVIMVPLGIQVFRQWAQVSVFLVRVQYQWLLASLASAVLSLGILGVAWILIAGALKISMGVFTDIRIYFTSNFAKRIPGTVWYVAGRAYLYRAKANGAWLVATGILLENALLLIAGLLLASILWPWQLALNVSAWIPVTLLIAVGIVILVCRYPTVFVRAVATIGRRKWDDQSSLAELRLPARDLLIWTILYLLEWIGGGISLYCFVRAFYPALNASDLPLMLGVATGYGLSGFIGFFIPAGMGVKEFAGSYLLARFIPLPLAIVIILLFRVNLLVAEMFWLILSYVTCRRLNTEAYKAPVNPTSE